MRSFRLVSAVALLFLLASAAPTYSQGQGEKDKQQQQQAKNKQQEPQQDKNRQQPPPKQQPPPRQQQQQANPARQQQQQGQQQQNRNQQQQEQRQHDQATSTRQLQHQQQPATRSVSRPQQTFGGSYHGGVQPTEPTYRGVHPSGVPQHQEQVRSGFAQSRAGSWNTDHRSWQQRGGYNGYRVPEDRFRGYFGSEHFFRISRFPMLFVGGYPRFQYDGYWVTFVDPWPEDWSPNWYETDDVYIDYSDDGYYVYNREHPGVGIAVTISF